MPQLPNRPTPEQLEAAYNEGFEGWIWDKDEERRWDELMGDSDTPTTEGLKDLHKKHKRVLLYQYREKFDPGAFGQENQQTGDCVSHGSRNARDTSRSVEIARGESETYYLRTATEPTYGARGHGSAGMNPTKAAQFETKYGFMFRDIYHDIHVDLSKYNANTGINWGKQGGVPDRVKKVCGDHKVGDWARPKGIGGALDLLAAGFAGHSGQQWGTKGSQPKDGVNRKNGNWNHDMATTGYDISEEFFKEPVVFVNNSWGSWNKPNPIWMANQDVYGPWVEGIMAIPIGEYERYFVKSGSIHFYSNIEGWQVKELPDIISGVL
jgi:hypothetical protein